LITRLVSDAVLEGREGLETEQPSEEERTPRIEEEKPVKKKKVVSKSAAAVTVAEIKAKMAQLREEKKAKAGDKAALKILRRRINRLRKRSRIAAAAAA